MRFWDTSAIAPLVAEEPSSARLRQLAREDPGMLVWWATEVECAAAIARRERSLPPTENHADLFAALGELATAWQVIEPRPEVKAAAVRMLRTYPLRAADALQLAAAYVGSQRRPDQLGFVTRDKRLAAAAVREGFPLVTA